MKRSIIIAVLGLATTAASYGQGLVNFKNYFSSTQTTGVSYGDGVNSGLYVGPEIKAQLAYFIGTTVDPNALTALSQGAATPIAFGLGVAVAPGALGSGAGWFDGGTVTIAGSAGQPMTYAVLAFNGADYNSSTIRGKSNLFPGSTSATDTSPTPDYPDVGNFQVFTVIVPEPSTFALIGLGTAGLLFFRRRK